MKQSNIKNIDLLKFSKSMKKHIESHSDLKIKLSAIQEATAKSLGFSNFNHASNQAQLFTINAYVAEQQKNNGKNKICDEFWEHERHQHKQSQMIYEEITKNGRFLFPNKDAANCNVSSIPEELLKEKNALLILTEKSILRFNSPENNTQKIYEEIKSLSEKKQDFGIINSGNHLILKSKTFYSIFNGDNKYISHNFNNENMMVFSGNSNFMSDLIRFCLNIKKYSDCHSYENTIYMQSSILHMFSHLYLQQYPYLSFDIFSEFVFLSETKKRLGLFYEIHDYIKDLKSNNKNPELTHYLSVNQLKDVYNLFHSELYKSMINVFSKSKKYNHAADCIFFTFDRDIIINKEFSHE